MITTGNLERHTATASWGSSRDSALTAGCRQLPHAMPLARAGDRSMQPRLRQAEAQVRGDFRRVGPRARSGGPVDWENLKGVTSTHPLAQCSDSIKYGPWRHVNVVHNPLPLRVDRVS
ncbi:unnamed protein product [Ectocarpus fasciculatus]